MKFPLNAGARLKAPLVGAVLAAAIVGCGGGGDPVGSPGQPMAASQSIAATPVSGSTQAPSMPANRPTPGG